MDGTAAFMPAQSPFLSNYSGLSNQQLMNQVSMQESYHPQAPRANQVEALNLVNEARDAVLSGKADPAAVKELLQRAYNEITPQGQGSQPAFSYSTSPSYPAQGSSIQGDNDADDAGSTSSAPGATRSGAPSLTSDTSANSVDTGRYLITGSNKDDGSLTIHDKQTGKDIEIWGDPHVKVNGQNVADFQKNGLSIQLADGTTVHIKPTDLQNGVSHIGQVAVTKGNDAVTMSGFDGGMHTSNDMQGQASNVSAMYDDPDNTNLTEGDDDNLYYNNANGSMGGMVKANSDGSETNLDGKGGGMIGHPSTSSAGGASSSNYSNLINQLLQSASVNMSQYMQSAMSSTLSDLMSQSGYQHNA
jgi:Domain of Unknown Function (DUF1521)